MQYAMGVMVGSVIGVVLGGLGGLYGRIAYDHWVRFPLDYDYAATLVAIVGAAIGGFGGALLGLFLVAVGPEVRCWGLCSCAGLVLLGAAPLAVVLNPYWRVSHWGNNAYLVHARLPRVNLRGRNLSGTNFYGADLSGAILADAVLQSATLDEANLQDADLRDVNLRHATLTGADLRGTKLHRADLRGAILEMKNSWEGTPDGGIRPTPSAILVGARYDRHTRWPDGFDPQQHGAARLE